MSNNSKLGFLSVNDISQRNNKNMKVVYVRPDQVGGFQDPPCFKIGYSRSARAESREGS